MKILHQLHPERGKARGRRHGRRGGPSHERHFLLAPLPQGVAHQPCEGACGRRIAAVKSKVQLTFFVTAVRFLKYCIFTGWQPRQQPI